MVNHVIGLDASNRFVAEPTVAETAGISDNGKIPRLQGLGTLHPSVIGQVGYSQVSNAQENRLLGWGPTINSLGSGQLIELGTGFSIVDGKLQFSGAGGESDAIDVAYDNTMSGLASEDVQAAIDELALQTVTSVSLRSRKWKEHAFINSINDNANDFNGATTSGFTDFLPTGSGNAIFRTNTSTANSGVWVAVSNGVSPGAVYELGPWGNTRRAAFLVYEPESGVAADVTVGFGNSTSATTPPSFFGLQKLTSGQWRLAIRETGTDLVTPVDITLPSVALVLVQYTVNSAQTEIQSISAEVRAWPGNTSAGAISWLGSSTGFVNTKPVVRAYRPVGTGVSQKLLGLFYFGYGFDPPVGLDFSGLI